MTVLYVPGTPGTTLRAGLPDLGGSLVTTLSLVNTSGSTQAANFVSPMLGMPFKQGDVPSGQYPQFQLTDNTPVPATVYSDTSWPDSSKKFSGVLLRPPASIAGSGTLTINVKNGGSAPAASSRTLSDLTAADIKVELTGVTNLSGVWTASLNTAITDAEEIVVIGDGPAGKVWRIRGAFKQSGAAHGQLVCYHYVAALQNSAGGLLGLRYLGRIAQPWADVASPTPARRVASVVLKSGATTLRTLTGHDTTETPGSNIAIAHYASFFTAGNDALWDYVQGGGSASADCTVRVVHDKAKVVATKMVPPINTALSFSSFASVNYVPNCLGSFSSRNIDNTGAANPIGVMPQWACTHAATRALVDERAVRVSAMAAAGWRISVRRSTTGKIIPVVDIAGSYTDLGTISTSVRYGGSNIAGIQNPSGNDSLWAGDTNTSHRGNPHFYAYLLTGEPQYLDLLTETGAHVIMNTDPGTSVKTVGSNRTGTATGTYAGFRNSQVGVGGTIYKGSGIMDWDGGVRIAAWALRDVAQATALQPDAPYDGGGVKAYLTDVLNSCFSLMAAWNAALPASWQAAGFVNTTQFFGTSGGDAQFDSPWMQFYFSLSACHASQIVPSTNAALWRTHLSKYISSTNSQMDLACLPAYRALQFRENAELIDTVQESLFATGSCTTTTSGNTFTLSGGLAGVTLTNGDRIAFHSKLGSASPMTGGADAKQYYVVNASGSTGQLSLTPGGSAVTVATSTTIGTFFAQIANMSPRNGQGDTYYMRLLYEAARFHEACGDSTIAAARAKQDAYIAAEGLSLTADARHAMLAAYPV